MCHGIYIRVFKKSRVLTDKPKILWGNMRLLGQVLRNVAFFLRVG